MSTTSPRPSAHAYPPPALHWDPPLTNVSTIAVDSPDDDGDHIYQPHLSHRQSSQAISASQSTRSLLTTSHTMATLNHDPALASGSTDLNTFNIEGLEGVGVKTQKQKNWANVQFVSLCWTLFLAGWNDGSTGPLLSRIREFYHVGFAVVSLVFVLACVGFRVISAALVNVPLSERLGFGKVLVLGSLLQVIGFTLQAPELPFPVFVISYMVNEAGLAMQDAQANGFVASISNSETRMGILHAAYGAGALSSPLVATQFAQMTHWSFYYLISLGIALSNTLILIMVFRFKNQQECLNDIGVPPASREDQTSAFRQLLRHKNVHLLAFFILVYVGVEVTIGGWIVTFITDQHGGDASPGYVSAAFFGGLMFGRVALLWVNQKIGESKVVFLYAVLAISLELVIWLVPSLIGNAVAISIVGILLGPMFPITMNLAGRVLPRWILTESIGWIAGFGRAGGAVFPFMTGALTIRFGIKSLQPLVVALMAFMTILWGLVPKKPIKVD